MDALSTLIISTTLRSKRELRIGHIWVLLSFLHIPAATEASVHKQMSSLVPIVDYKICG